MVAGFETCWLVDIKDINFTQRRLKLPSTGEPVSVRHSIGMLSKTHGVLRAIKKMLRLLSQRV